MRWPLVIAAAAALAGGAAATGGAAQAVLAGGAIPRLDPFDARAVPCGATSCLDISWRVRGDIGPRVAWELDVIRPDGRAVYRGTGMSRTGKRVTGRLVPAERPPCGRYRVSVTVEDAAGYHFDDTRTVVRRTGCAAPHDR